MGKAIYQPKGKAKEFAEWACNIHRGCSCRCSYCFNKKGISSKTLGGDTPVLKDGLIDENKALTIFKKELNNNLPQLQEHGLLYSFTTDPLLPECSDLTWETAMYAMENDVPVKILTKIASKSFVDLVEHMHDSWKKLIAIGFTLTGRDDLEPGASSNGDRITCMMELFKHGFITWASIEPIIEFNKSADMIEHTWDFCKLYKIGLESGRKYDKHECRQFIEHFQYMSRIKGFKVYWKDSILKQAGYNRETLMHTNPNCVNSNYNIFKNN